MDGIDIAVLGFLLEDEKHGYELFKEITDTSGFEQIYTIKIGRLYAILNKLNKKEFISSRIARDGNRPPKKVFEITRKGRESFDEWMSEPIRHGRDIRIHFLIKLFFLRKNDRFSYMKLIEIQIKECQEWLALQKEKIKALQNNEQFEFYIRQFRKTQIEGYINWLNWCKRSLLDD